jgi:RNA:NAD 2'-phosphotransferase (TPT1/KptA family)
MSAAPSAPRRRCRRPADPPDVRLSKQLSAVLRHRGEVSGLRVAADGYVAVEDLLGLPQFSGVTLGDLARVVERDGKQRYSLREDGGGGGWFIRANQGHTMTCVESGALLQRVTVESAAQYAVCVHGTTRAAWAQIRLEGLRRMARNHVHFACGLPGEGVVVSGMRAAAEVLVFVDVVGAVEGGVPFYLSGNGVLLSPGVQQGGVEGVVPPRFFRSVC